MKKYKLGDKIVLQIIQDDSYGDYKIGDDAHGWWTSSELIDNVAEPLSKYIKSMAEKLYNQRAEINRLLKENKELKINANWCDNCAKADSIDEARAAGQQEAWELAKKIVSAVEYGGYSKNEMIKIFDTYFRYNVIADNTYPEAAAKVSEWERQKEEICVGDVVIDWNGDTAVVIQNIDDSIKLLYGNSRTHAALKGKLTKTGRHIDVDAWLAQIGGEGDD